MWPQCTHKDLINLHVAAIVTFAHNSQFFKREKIVYACKDFLHVILIISEVFDDGSMRVFKLHAGKISIFMLPIFFTDN